MRSIEFDKQKAFNALIYFLREYPGATKTQIMKFFFLVDFGMYRKKEKPVFGGPYLHMDRGPVPSKVYNELLPEAIKRKIAKEEKIPSRGMRYYLNADLEPDISLFTVGELDMMHKTIGFLKHLKTARNVSEFTHSFSLWKYTENGEPIPYEFAKMSPKEIEEYLEEHRFYKNLARKLPKIDPIPESYWEDYEVLIPDQLQREMLEQISD